MASLFLNVFVWTIFPLAAFIMLLFSIPQWSVVRRFNLWLTDKVLFFRLPVLGGSLTLYTVMLFLATATLAGSIWEVQRAQADYVLTKKFGRLDEHALARKFRCERNFWLSCFALTLWLLVLRMRQLHLDIAQLETTVEVSSRLVRQAGQQPWFPGPGANTTTGTGAAGSGGVSGGKTAAMATGVQTSSASAASAAIPSAPLASPPGPKFRPSAGGASASAGTERSSTASPPGTDRSDAEEDESPSAVKATTTVTTAVPAAVATTSVEGKKDK